MGHHITRRVPSATGRYTVISVSLTSDNEVIRHTYLAHYRSVISADTEIYYKVATMCLYY